jgi:Holliday junction DNA helicase RuvA
MYYYLEGHLVRCTEAEENAPAVVLAVGGQAFELVCTQRCIQQLPPLGSPLRLYTVWVQREEQSFLVGFLQEAERDVFKLLRQASGVGPKMALALLELLTPTEVLGCLRQGEAKLLHQAKGVGPKLAQKMVLELQEKAEALWKRRQQQALQAAYPAAVAHPTAGVPTEAQAAQWWGDEAPKDALAAEWQEALAELGYNAVEVERAWRSLLAEESPEAVATWADETLFAALLKRL